MPKFTIRIAVTNLGSASITAHVGASLVGATDHIEYYNTTEDFKHEFSLGISTVERYLTTDLGINQKYYLYVALWEAEKPIGEGIKYAGAVVKNAVEKKKKIAAAAINLTASVSSISPTSFFGE